MNSVSLGVVQQASELDYVQRALTANLRCWSERQSVCTISCLFAHRRSFLLHFYLSK